MHTNLKKHKDDLMFLPLGGANEIGLNVNLYHYKGKWIMFDLGAGFADETLPGIDMLVPDLAFVHQLKGDFLGVVLTHGHEDHLGAVHYLWKELRCQIYATPFTAALVRNKLKETSYAKDVKIKIVDPGSKFSVGPFDLEMVQLTHSIPEMNAIAIRTEHGNILHTGDWKFDPNPLIGPLSNEEALKRYGDKGVLALVCDSTNVFSPGHSGSEGDLKESLAELIGKCPGLVVVTTFASNVARVETIYKAAKANGRKVLITGRSLHRITGAAKETGYLKDVIFTNENEYNKLKRSEMLIISTGCQGEVNAAISKMTEETHAFVRLKPNDTVIFSSKIIPGNEKKIFRLFNRFVEMGVEVYTEKDHFVHVSGHPNREELEKMYKLTKPKIAIPVHGERVHIHEHVRFAGELGVPIPIQVQNGDIIKIAPGKPERVGVAQSGYYAVDGSSIIPLNSDIFKVRRKLRDGGLVMVTIVITNKGELVAPPKIIAPGVLDSREDKELINYMSEEIESAISVQRRPTNETLENTARSAVRRIFKKEVGKLSTIEVQIIRV